ncbi:MAG: adenine nucleotide alpha hydrolase [Spirochaetes bacterium]|nr:adenine nucleotide alpha hydrolase [Spirochaetota bacterium]
MNESIENVIFSWSGGKDSSMALYEILNQKKYKVSALLTTVSTQFDRISMHGVRSVLLERQAESLGLPLEKVLVPSGSSNEEYEAGMRAVLERYRAKGISKVVFGDIFLEDLKKYREEKLALLDMEAVFPLWKKDTTEIVSRCVNLGFRTILTCVDTSVIDGDFAGRVIDEQLISEFPNDADICGENGEYHSFVYSGPIFKKDISFSVGEKVLRDNRFRFCDLIPD